MLLEINNNIHCQTGMQKRNSQILEMKSELSARAAIREKELSKNSYENISINILCKG